MSGGRRIVASRLGLQLFSVALALAIFFAVRSEDAVTSTVGIPLALREPPTLINTADVPAEITVRLSGPSGAIAGLRSDRVAPITLDLRDMEQGSAAVRIREDQLGLPLDLEVVSISPSTVNVRLEPRVVRKVPVRVTTEGKPAEGLAVERTEVDPGEVMVVGPRREVDGLRFVRTVPVDLAGAKDTFTASVAFELPGGHTRVEEGPQRAEVKILLAPERMERTVQVQVATSDGVPALPVRATLAGPRTVLERIDERSLRAVLAEDVEPGSPAALLIENLPEGVEIIEPLPTLEPGD